MPICRRFGRPRRQKVLNFLGESVLNPDRHSVEFQISNPNFGDKSEIPFKFFIHNKTFDGVIKLKESIKGFIAEVQFKEESTDTKSYIELYSEFIKNEFKNELKKFGQ